MSEAYYNEFDSTTAAWLEELIRKGHIAPGQVDTRSIEDVRPDDLRGFTQCHFFAGIGVWSYALRRAGWPDDRPVWTGSCPCQPFSSAGKGAAFDDERHLWPAFHHLIKVCRPASILGEQVASASVDDWIDLVHADLEALGYAFGSIPFPSAGVGAPHIRDRNFWMAHTGSPRLSEQRGRWQQSSRLAKGGALGTLGNTSGPGLAQRQRQRQRGILGGTPGAVKGQAVVGASLHAGRLANSNGGFIGNGELQRQHEHGLVATDGSSLRQGGGGPQSGVERLADNELQQRPDGKPGVRDVNAAPGRQQSAAEVAGLRGDHRPGPTNGFWRDTDWLRCRDGKWRPVESGSFPLAYGLAAGMGKLLPGALRLAGLAGLDAASLKRAKSHRIIGLRGAGNAINAEAAIAWIETVMECIA